VTSYSWPTFPCDHPTCESTGTRIVGESNQHLVCDEHMEWGSGGGRRVLVHVLSMANARSDRWQRRTERERALVDRIRSAAESWGECQQKADVLGLLKEAQR
jgi:hypothetical protein